MAFNEKTCFYKIYTKRNNSKDVVSVGSDGNILSWEWRGGGEDTQRWVIAPLPGGKCNIITQQNGENMGVGSYGNILRWPATGKKDQEFEFTNEKSGWYNIKEFTKNEYVAVGSNGNILRWERTGNDDQLFKPVAVNEVEPPEVSSGDYNPGEIPSVPRIEGFDVMPPETSPKYLIGEVAIPAVFVNDPAYANKASQVEGTPYYILRREQYWSREPGRGNYIEWESNYEENWKVKTTTGITETITKSIESTLGIEFDVGGDFIFKGITASIEAKITSAIKQTVSGSSTVMTTYEEEHSFTLPAAHFVRTAWGMVDRYTLIPVKDTKRCDAIYTWEVVVPNVVVSDSYPNM